MNSIVVCALYKFTALDDYQALRLPLQQLMDNHHIKGTLLLAKEGINGTVAGPQAGIDALLSWFNSDSRLQGLDYKLSYHDTPPFFRARVKLKKEIVTMGVEGLDPTKTVGTYIKPKDWNQLISSPDVILIDTRNDYEIAIGTFKNAINPKTQSFREFPEFAKQHLDPTQHKRIAMVCTGGIRCEKSTAYLKEQGFDEVYHLKGGILKYLEEIPEEDSLWKGECFVFDNRVSVNHSLEKGRYDMCHGCRHPITEEEKQSPLYTQGVSCPYCHETLTEVQKQRFSEREKQMQLAKTRGQVHLGSDAPSHNNKSKQKSVR